MKKTELTPENIKVIIELLNSEKTLEAMKYVSKEIGCNLAHSKDIVDKHRKI